MGRWLRRLGKVLVVAFVVFGAIQEAQGAPQTARWLKQIGVQHSQVPAMLLTALLALALLAIAFPHRARALFGLHAIRSGRPTTSRTKSENLPSDDRPISVRIDRDPVWHNFNYEAYIAEVHVVMTNQTDADVEIAGGAWEYASGGISSVEVARETERYKRQRPQLLRHSIIEAGKTESGWTVVAIAYNAGDPELPKLSIKVSGYRDTFEAWR
jgi:hypothetical protein